MLQADSGEVLCIKREKFRVQIRNQRLSQEFQKKRRQYDVQTKRNEFLEKLIEELTNYQLKEQLLEEDFANIKLLLNIILKALEEDQNIDFQFTQNLVGKFKQDIHLNRFLIKLSRIDQEYLEYSINIIQSTLFYLNKEDYSKFNELDDPELLVYFDMNLKTEILDILPQTLTCLSRLMQEKQSYRDYLINNEFEVIRQAILVDRFRQFSEVILGITLQSFSYCLCINIDKIPIIKEFIMGSYYDENIAIRRLVLFILEELPEKLPKNSDSEFADEFVRNPIFFKIFDAANKPFFDFFTQKVVLTYFGLCTILDDKQLQFYQKILQQSLASPDVHMQIRIQLYWAISNKLIDIKFITQIIESKILDQIFANCQSESISEKLEISFIIQNLAKIVKLTVIQANLEQLTKILKLGLIEICEHLFSLQEQTICDNILQSLTILLKKFSINSDVNNELILPFEELRLQIERKQLVDRILESKCDQSLINDFDVYF